MTKTVSQPALFRKLLKKGIIVLPGAFNAASAMLIEKCGFKAVYMSGAGISNSAGLPDIGILARDEFVQQASYIASAVNIPVIADADTGFGGPSEVKETVRAFERAGVAGIQIEDQKPVTKKCGHLAGKEVISAKAMGEKIKAACRARRDKDFLIIARTDARGVNGFNDAVKRAKVYADAGADVIFPEALESKDEFKEFAKLVDESLMANMTEFGKTPYISIREFREMGYSIVLFPMTVFRIGMKAMEEALIELKRKETQKELYKLLGYEK